MCCKTAPLLSWSAALIVLLCSTLYNIAIQCLLVGHMMLTWLYCIRPIQCLLVATGSHDMDLAILLCPIQCLLVVTGSHDMDLAILLCPIQCLIGGHWVT